MTGLGTYFLQNSYFATVFIVKDFSPFISDAVFFFFFFFFFLRPCKIHWRRENRHQNMCTKIM